MLFGWFRKSAPKREIVVNVEKLETRVAVVENGRVEEFQVEHPTEERLVGSIYKGRIQNLEHDLQAAFVDIGLKKNAFLHYWDMLPDDDSRLDDDEENARPMRRRRVSNEEITKRFPPGSEIVVQVTKGPIGTKGPRVTANLSLPGRYLVMMPGTRLRNIGGLVVVDLIDMKSRKHQNAVYKAMKSSLKRDRARTNVLAISELGLMEMTRQRQEESLLSQMYSDCPFCRGHGLVKSPLALSVDIQRQIAALMRKVLHEGRDVELQIVVAPSVLERLRTEDEAFLVDLQRRYTGRLTFKSEMHRHPESFCIADGQTGKILYSVGEAKTV